MLKVVILERKLWSETSIMVYLSLYWEVTLLIFQIFNTTFGDIFYYSVLNYCTTYGLPGVDSDQQQRSVWRNNRWNCDRLCHLRGPICGRGLELHVPLRRNLRHADEDLRQTPGQQTVCQLMSRGLGLAWQRSLSWHVSVLWCYRISYLQT